jgi:taurine dioxygenase
MTHREVPGFVNVLYGIRIPHRDGKPLGGTEFSNMHLAYLHLTLVSCRNVSRSVMR